MESTQKENKASDLNINVKAQVLLIYCYIGWQHNML